MCVCACVCAYTYECVKFKRERKCETGNKELIMTLKLQLSILSRNTHEAKQKNRNSYQETQRIVHYRT